MIFIFNFLKYVNVTVTQANGKTKVRQLERNNYVEKLSSTINMWLKKSQYTISGEELDKCIETNTLDYLPDDVKDKFVVDDCYVEIDFTENDITELKNNIIKTVNEINQKTDEYNKLKDIDKELINHCLVNKTFMDTISKYGTTEYVKVLEDLNERI